MRQFQDLPCSAPQFVHVEESGLSTHNVARTLSSNNMLKQQANLSILSCLSEISPVCFRRSGYWR
jgi:hypothetical protein